MCAGPFDERIWSVLPEETRPGGRGSERKGADGMRRQGLVLLGLLLALSVVLAGCGTNADPSGPEEISETVPASQTQTVPTPESTASPVQPTQTNEEDTAMNMTVTVNGTRFTAILEQNGAVDALVELLRDGPVTLQLSDYAGFEKVGPLGQSLPTSNSQTTTQPGDIVLYQGNQIVLFYGSNSWSYTRLGRIADLTGWTQALGSGDVTVILSLED